MYESIRSTYPQAHITTVGEHEGPNEANGLTTHVQISLAKLSEYSLHATLGSPKIDIMVMNVPKVTKVTFKDDCLNRQGCQRKQEDSHWEAKTKIERMYSLFRMISPSYWIFYGFSAGEKSKSGRLGNSFLSQHLEHGTFHSQMWTNLEVNRSEKKDRRMLALGPNERRRILLSGKFRNEIANSYHEVED